ncbi:hypothetical protein NDU88_000451 [Pleurodeles waltl]|uniref:Uncharacterized protein n=1 Tax=Pleurodeles waltl TaxID=8319 RepID=A0AAV7U510_PLEWA|nr:hypothetical protein NDU88_000451 [Pleurodeles waltl]
MDVGEWTYSEISRLGVIEPVLGDDEHPGPSGWHLDLKLRSCVTSVERLLEMEACAMPWVNTTDGRHGGLASP